MIKRTGSLAVSADQTHYLGDLVTNIGVVIAILLATVLGWQLADPIIALLVAAVLVGSAWLVFRKSLDQLMDHELPDADREKIIGIVRAHPQVKSLHDLRTRAAGLYTFIQVHIELDPGMPLAEAHAVSDEVEHALCAAFDKAEVIIHQDPAGLEEVPEQSATAGNSCEIQSHDPGRLALDNGVDDARGEEPERAHQQRHGDHRNGELVTGFGQYPHRDAGAGDHEGEFSDRRQEQRGFQRGAETLPRQHQQQPVEEGLAARHHHQGGQDHPDMGDQIVEIDQKAH